MDDITDMDAIDVVDINGVVDVELVVVRLINDEEGGAGGKIVELVEEVTASGPKPEG